ncbi:MAG: SPFH domain-containing protein [Phycisphaerae bacterium]
MDEHSHHDHEHSHDDGEGGRGSIAPPGGLSGLHADTASRSLSDALRWSFRILTVIMVLVGIMFLGTGIHTIGSNEKGVRKVFGRIVGEEVPPGFAWTWPFPIGQIEKVNVKPKLITIEDFWMNETPEDKTAKSLSARRVMSQVLKPGWDGALFTGDRELLHVKLTYAYVIDQVLLFKQNVPEVRPETDPDKPPVASPTIIQIEDPDTKQKVDAVLEPIRSAICDAAVRVAASMTADKIRYDYGGPGGFLEQVQRLAQKRLTEARTGIRIISITIPSEGITRPLAVEPLYEAANSARQRKEALVQAAWSDANNLINNTIGAANRRALLGDRFVFSGTAGLGALHGPAASYPTAGATGSDPSAAADSAADYDLIGQYNEADDRGDKATAAKVLAKINEVLTKPSLGGRAAGIILAANTEANKITQDMEGRARTFEKLLAEYRKNPQFLREREWADVLREILGSPWVIKFPVNTDGPGKTVILIQDPAVPKAMEEWPMLPQPKKEEPKPTPMPSPPPPPPGPGGP